MTNQERTSLIAGSTSDMLACIRRAERQARQSMLRYQCMFVVYWEVFSDVAATIKRENEIQDMSLKKRKQLIHSANPGWQFLNEAMIREVGTIFRKHG